MVYEVFDKKKGQGAIASMNEELVPELNKPKKKGRFMPFFKIKIGQ